MFIYCYRSSMVDDFSAWLQVFLGAHKGKTWHVLHIKISFARIFQRPWSTKTRITGNYQSWVSRATDIIWYTAVGQAVACVPVMQQARVRSPIGTSFLGEVFWGFSSPVRQISGSFWPPRPPNIIWPSLSPSIIFHYGRQWPEMLTRPTTSNIEIH